MRARPLEPGAVEEEVHLLVVEGDEAGDREHFTQGEVVGPGNVGMDPVADPGRPVAAGGALVGTGGHGVRRDQMGEVDVGPVEVVAGREPRLEEQDGRGGLGEHDTLRLHPHRPGRTQARRPRVYGLRGWTKTRSSSSNQASRADHSKRTVSSSPSTLAAPRTRAAPGRWTYPTRRPYCLTSPRAVFRRGALVDQHQGIDVGKREVVLREAGPFPHVAGAGRVDDRPAGEERPGRGGGRVRHD